MIIAMTSMVTGVLYALLGWHLVLRDLLPRLDDRARELCEEYGDLYQSREARNGLIREYRMMARVLAPMFGLMFPAYFAVVYLRDRKKGSDDVQDR